ncbi:MAG TPA: response regulator [Cyclobacteriaceae bacterium]|nr:response regulator [Cyclobacteriaceae bacterium]
MKKVLAVHWQEEILTKIEQLAPSGWHVLSMGNSVEAMLSTRAEQYDLIFCCLNLPMVTGIELIRSIRTLSVNKHTPVFVITDGIETIDQRVLVKKLHTVWLSLEDVSTIPDIAN